jgi:hypothetical protein
VPEDGGVEVKPMFGNVGAFVNGSMFMGLFGPEERPMSGYVTLPRGLSRARAQFVGRPVARPRGRAAAHERSAKLN